MVSWGACGKWYTGLTIGGLGCAATWKSRYDGKESLQGAAKVGTQSLLENYRKQLKKGERKHIATKRREAERRKRLRQNNKVTVRLDTSPTHINILHCAQQVKAQTGRKWGTTQRPGKDQGEPATSGGAGRGALDSKTG